MYKLVFSSRERLVGLLHVVDVTLMSHDAVVKTTNYACALTFEVSVTAVPCNV